MNLTENVPQTKGVSLLFELSEMIERQGFFIGQEVFYKSRYYTEKVKISGYTFRVENSQLRLGYLVETVESIRQVLEGTSDFPDEMLVSIDDLFYPSHINP